MKKKILTLILILTMFTVASCGKTEIDVNEFASKLASEGTFAEELAEISSDVTLKRYGLDENIVEECASYAATMAFVDEVVVFKTKDVAAVEEAVSKHIEAQKESYTSYRPDELPKLSNGLVTVSGDYVIVCVSEDVDAAGRIINENIK